MITFRNYMRRLCAWYKDMFRTKPKYAFSVIWSYKKRLHYWSKFTWYFFSSKEFNVPMNMAWNISSTAMIHAGARIVFFDKYVQPGLDRLEQMGFNYSYPSRHAYNEYLPFEHVAILMNVPVEELKFVWIEKNLCPEPIKKKNFKEKDEEPDDWRLQSTSLINYWMSFATRHSNIFP